MPITLEKNGAMRLLHLDGEVTVAQAAELKLELALKEGNNVRLDLESVTEMDITALQLLWAAHHKAKKQAWHFSPQGACQMKFPPLRWKRVSNGFRFL